MTDKEIANSVAAVLEVAKGLIVWNPIVDEGGYLTLEFGEPFLVVRDPVTGLDPLTEKVRHSFERRRVWPRGQVHLWLQECSWVIRLGEQLASETDREALSEVFKTLEGQVLEEVVIESGDRLMATLEFDLGAVLQFGWLVTMDSDEEVFSLWTRGGERRALLANGHLTQGLYKRNIYTAP